ncbi:DUF4330 domain-containing protein [Gudongella sp. SC589]|jgi:hypothetical protein|uniref:DUF4330 domain-containing protein n=1 Tax=Gudongella sp. SC589 TaxID=3385990 RepID=UPI003904C464
MKIINKEGKVFNRINILDLIFVAAIVLLLFLSAIKIMGKDIEDIGSSAESVQVRFVASIPYEKGYLDSINIGDTIGETKQYLQAEVVHVEIVPVYETNLDWEGNPVRSVDPTMEEARVTIEGTLPYESMSYKLGAQEIRQGKIIFIESDFYRLKGQIETIEVVN